MEVTSRGRTLWPIALVAAFSGCLTLATSVLLDRVTFNCSVEDCSADTALLFLPFGFAFLWGLALARSSRRTRTVAIGAAAVVAAGVANWIDVVNDPPDQDKWMSYAGIVFVFFVVGPVAGMGLSAAGSWLATRVPPAAGGLVAAGMLVASLWLPWIRVHDEFGDNAPHVLNGIELRPFGSLILAGAALVVVALPATTRGKSPAWLAVAGALVCLGAVMGVSLSEGLLVDANEVVSPGESELPLRLVDLAFGLPAAIAGATIALCWGVLVLRTDARRSAA